MGQTYTAIFEKVPEGYIAFVQEIPGVNTQGETLDIARENLKEALELILQCRRELVEKEIKGKEIIKEPIHFEEIVTQ
ncbi:MAG: type II toxin-antitoxin system HicB family antitoxin [Candidatus Sigynarchaeota archaeon]